MSKYVLVLSLQKATEKDMFAELVFNVEYLCKDGEKSDEKITGLGHFKNNTFMIMEKTGYVNRNKGLCVFENHPSRIEILAMKYNTPVSVLESIEEIYIETKTGEKITAPVKLSLENRKIRAKKDSDLNDLLKQ